jgi:hypothetical protein
MFATTGGSGRTVLAINPFGPGSRKLARNRTYTVTIEGARDADGFAVKDLAGSEMAATRSGPSRPSAGRQRSPSAPGGQVLECLPGHAVDRPPTHRGGADALVEADGRLVPIEDRPLEPATVTVPGQPRDVDE